MSIRKFVSMILFVSSVILSICATIAVAQENQQPLLVHEWGTFTVLQDEHGSELPGVNINEEALPPFVYRLSQGLVPDAHRYSPVLGSHQYAEKKYMAKGIPRGFPAVTMRMETPIVYFHLPDGQNELTGVDVRVGFKNGWISEWFPQAIVDAPGFLDRDRRIKAGSSGTIHWNGLTLRSVTNDVGDNLLAETESNVWLAPRNVDCDVVSTSDGQSEKYLFYRGVADMPSPLSVARSDDGRRLMLSTRPGQFAREQPDQVVRALYLVHITDDQQIAYREFNYVKLPTGGDSELLLDVPAYFSEADYKGDGMERLHDSMRSALKQEGLFTDEANAFLATWQLSYFRSPGLRIFFTLPGSWTDQVLPLEVSVNSEISRAMMGRIELVTPEQRALLNEMKSGTISNRNWFNDALKDLTPVERRLTIKEIQEGKRTLESLNVKVPADYQAFMQLGRFRDALVLDAAKDSEPLRRFAGNYGLSYFQ